MDRTEKPRKPHRFSNCGELSEADAVVLPGPTGREASALESVTGTPMPATRRSEITGRHDSGSGANDTADGLTSSEEAMRRGAEETPIGAKERDTLEDVPVFDRAHQLPKV